MNDPVSDDLVQIESLTRRFGDLTAVDGISLAVHRGEMFGLIGPDGAGKTTTLRVLLGLLAPHGGTVRTCGLDPLRQGALLSRKIGYLSQRFSLYGDLSIDENIAFFAEIHGVGDFRGLRDQLLEMTQLTPFRRRLADRLSGGMKQKLALACTLIHQPQFILLDEPTTGVDPVSRREFWKLLSQFVERGITILMSTPYLDEAERCHRIALLHEGKMLALDEPGRLRQSLPGTWFELVVDEPRQAVARLAAAGDEVRTFVFGDRLHVWLSSVGADDARSALDRYLSSTNIVPAGVRPILPSLEDVFVARLTGAVPA